MAPAPDSTTSGLAERRGMTLRSEQFAADQCAGSARLKRHVAATGTAVDRGIVLT
jgi:hypothetical protein